MQKGIDFERKHEEDLRRIRDFRLMDDNFMSKVFEDKPCAEFLLRIILNRDDLKVKEVHGQRLRQRRMEREAKERERLAELYEDCDDRFAFIAGYTDGGAPFGVMWEEVGIDPGLPFEEKVNLYHMQMLG